MVLITRHALDRYREHIDGSQTNDELLNKQLLELYDKSNKRKIKKAERLRNKKSTVYVTNNKCIFIVVRGRVVTVLARKLKCPYLSNAIK